MYPKKAVKLSPYNRFIILGVMLAFCIKFLENRIDMNITYTYLPVTIMVLLIGKLIWNFSFLYSLIINCIFLSMVSLGWVVACTIVFIQTKSALHTLPIEYRVPMLWITEAVIILGMLFSAAVIRKIPREIKKINFVIIIIPNSISIIAMTLLSNKIFYGTSIVYNLKSSILVLSVGFLLTAGCVCNILVMQNYLNVKQIENDKKMRIREMSLQYDYYAILEKDINGVRGLAHDIRNHLEALSGNEDEKKEEYIESMKSILNQYESYYNTGNTFADNILHKKKLDAMEQEIELKVLADLKPFKNIKNVDLCVIISNILDNALRECELRKKETPYEENLIQLKVGQFRGFLSIICLNSIRENQAKYILSSEELRTTKQDKNKHGYGFKNIECVVKKYEGEISRNVTDGMFIISIIIPI